MDKEGMGSMAIVIIVAMILIFLVVILRCANIKEVKVKLPFMSIDIDTKDAEHRTAKKKT